MVNYNRLLSTAEDLSILLVEDYEPLCSDILDILEDFFSLVVVAKNGKEALKLYEEALLEDKKGFDIVLSDVQMPIMNGVELSQAIRKIDPQQSIIVLSAYTDSDILIDLINIGITKFITKPLDYDEFIKTLADESLKISNKSIPIDYKNSVVLGEGYFWDIGKRALFVRDKEISLTKHERILLELFIEKEGQIYTTKEMAVNLYSRGININEANIRNLVFKLRKKIPKNSVVNIYGLGYKFVLNSD